jgi:branched-chain amino acid transport system substrate-binding protein
LFSSQRAKWLWLIASLAIIALFVVACGDDDDSSGDDTGGAGFKTVTIASGDPIKIGISSILAGDLESLGVPIAQAAELAGEGVEIDGHSIEFVRKDDQCTPEGGASAASQLIEEGVVAVVGPVCSGSVIAAQDLYEAAGISHVSPSSTAIAATAPDRGTPYPTFFRVTYNDGIQGPAQAQFALDQLGSKSAYVVYDTDAYGSGLRDAFGDAFEAGGGKIAGSEGYEKKTTDFQSIVTNITSSDADLVYFAGFYAEATPFLQQLRQVDADIPFLAGDGVRDDEFLAGAGADAEGAYLSLPSPVLQGAVFDDFASRFEASTGEKATDSPFTAEAFDSATVLVMAIKATAVADGDSLKIDLAKLNDAIRATDFDGAIGHIKFDEKGDNAGGETPVTLFVVENGEFVAYK